MNDLQLRQDVIDELNSEPGVDGARIGVAAEEGIVTLTGHVSTYVEWRSAVAAARRIKSVRAIADEIEVQYPFDKKTQDVGIVKRIAHDLRSFLFRWIEDGKAEDDVLAQRAIDVLQSDPLVADNSIQVAVGDGRITLYGAADWNYQKMAAEDDVRKLPGVTRVIDNIKTVNKDFGQAIASGFSNYVNFSGRTSQSEYWFWVLFATLGMIVTWFLDAAIFVHISGEFVSGICPLYSPINFVFVVALLLPSLAIAVRRLHDVDRTGWWMLLALTGIGIVLLLFWQYQKGTSGSNKFGNDPLSKTAF